MDVSYVVGEFETFEFFFAIGDASVTVGNPILHPFNVGVITFALINVLNGFAVAPYLRGTTKDEQNIIGKKMCLIANLLCRYA